MPISTRRPSCRRYGRTPLCAGAVTQASGRPVPANAYGEAAARPAASTTLPVTVSGCERERPCPLRGKTVQFLPVSPSPCRSCVAHTSQHRSGRHVTSTGQCPHAGSLCVAWSLTPVPGVAASRLCARVPGCAALSAGCAAFRRKSRHPCSGGANQGERHVGAASARPWRSVPRRGTRKPATPAALGASWADARLLRGRAIEHRLAGRPAQGGGGVTPAWWRISQTVASTLSAFLSTTSHPSCANGPTTALSRRYTVRMPSSR